MEPKVLYPSRWRLLFFGPFCGFIIAATGYTLIFESQSGVIHLTPEVQHEFGWFMVICSGIWVGIGLINFLPKACFLKLDYEGMTAACMFLSFTLKWKNVRGFRATQLEVKGIRKSSQRKPSSFVVADVFDPSGITYNSRLCTGFIGYIKGPEAYAAYVRNQFGADAILASNYGLTTEGLVDLLNVWRLRMSDSAQRGLDY